MLPSRFSPIKNLAAAAFAVAAITFVVPRTARAQTLDYTFTGDASGTITGTGGGSFTDFTLSFVENPSTVVNAGGGYYRYNDIDATFTAGAYTATLTDVTIVVNGTSGFDNVNFFNSTFDDGLGIQDNAALANYALATPVNTGTVTLPADLEQTLNLSGDGFSTTGGGEVEFTSAASSLQFTASPTPEPSSLLLLTTGLSGLGLLRRRFFA